MKVKTSCCLYFVLFGYFVLHFLIHAIQLRTTFVINLYLCFALEATYKNKCILCFGECVDNRCFSIDDSCRVLTFNRNVKKSLLWMGKKNRMNLKFQFELSIRTIFKTKHFHSGNYIVEKKWHQLHFQLEYTYRFWSDLFIAIFLLLLWLCWNNWNSTDIFNIFWEQIKSKFQMVFVFFKVCFMDFLILYDAFHVIIPTNDVLVFIYIENRCFQIFLPTKYQPK